MVIIQGITSLIGKPIPDFVVLFYLLGKWINTVRQMVNQ